MGYSGRTDLLERLGGLWDDKGAMLRFSSFLFFVGRLCYIAHLSRSSSIILLASCT